MARRSRNFDEVMDGGNRLDRHHAGAWNHRVVSRLVGKADRPGEKLDLARVEGAFLAARPDEVLELVTIGGGFEFLCGLNPDRAGQPIRHAIEQRDEGSGEHAVDRGRASEGERRLERLRRCDRLRDELAEHHLHNGGDNERDSDRHPGRRVAEHVAEVGLDDLGDRWLGERAKRKRRDRDAELRTGQVIREPTKKALHLCGSGAALAGTVIDPGAINGDERELGSNETGVGDHEAERGQES